MIEELSYLRYGRKIRGRGTKIDASSCGMIKVRPIRPDWRPVWISAEELAAGSEKPPMIPRKQNDKPRKSESPKPKPLPAWRKSLNKISDLRKAGELYIETSLIVAVLDHFETTGLLSFEPTKQ